MQKTWAVWEALFLVMISLTANPKQATLRIHLGDAQGLNLYNMPRCRIVQRFDFFQGFTPLHCYQPPLLAYVAPGQSRKIEKRGEGARYHRVCFHWCQGFDSAMPCAKIRQAQCTDHLLHK